MKGSAGLRASTATAVAAVLGIRDGKNASLSNVLADPRLQPQRETDHARFRAWCYQVLRDYHRIDLMLAELLDKPLRRRDLDIYALLLLAATQLCDSDTAEHAIVSESVNAAKQLRKPRLKSLVNAVLRRFIDQRAKLEELVDQNPVGRYSHPQWLIDFLQRDWPNEWQEILEANNRQAPMWLRVNLAKNSRDEFIARLHDSPTTVIDEQLESTPPTAVRLARPVDVHALPGFADGCVSVQDAAAQLAAFLLDAQPGMRVLDACAAPGGKTCHLQELANNRLHLDALDIDAKRLELVTSNLQRLRLNARLLHADVGDLESWWDQKPYQRILLDVPCSATGVIRRHPDIKLLRRETDIDALARRQANLLQRVWQTLAKGGRLLYASCSTLRAENSDQVECFLKNQKDAELIWASDSLIKQIEERFTPVTGVSGIQLLPGRSEADGFYYALIEKA